ncbi:replication protein A 32 kDa subunit-like [Neocloeon triangulifer]|uniref:replication protein A 32 kDa subunit-like n=1 Tax=Neocloeon triangulifer TaxID=2078957 RepID=UPI00286EC902|nr:replication protein A 32 kDa subunit-like [Neocloeon triangulifer]
MFNQPDSQNAEGGFFNDSTFSPNVDKKRDAPRKQQTIGNVTIKQIVECAGDTIVFAGSEINLVKVFARVKGINDTSVKTEYLLEDDTGTILGVSWRDGDAGDDRSKKLNVVENTLCAIVGTIRTVEERKNLLVLHIDVVENANELTTHLLSIAHMKLKAQIRSSKEHQPNGAPAASNVVNGVGNGNAGGSPNRVVHQFVTEMGANEDAGVGKDLIVRHFAGQFSARQIEEIIMDLCNEGQLYTTIDDDHYKSTE